METKQNLPRTRGASAQLLGGPLGLPSAQITALGKGHVPPPALTLSSAVSQEAALATGVPAHSDFCSASAVSHSSKGLPVYSSQAQKVGFQTLAKSRCSQTEIPGL